MKASNTRFCAAVDTPRKPTKMGVEERLEALTEADKVFKEARAMLDQLRLTAVRLGAKSVTKGDLDAAIERLVHAHIWILEEKYTAYDEVQFRKMKEEGRAKEEDE